jgi:hypothetical protein
VRQLFKNVATKLATERPSMRDAITFPRLVRFSLDDYMVNTAEKFELYKRLSVITIV